MWFSFGAWIGETMRRRHGGHWLMMGDDPHTWRIGFSKIFLEIAPFVFAEQLLRMGSGATRKMVTEIERIRQLHEEQTEKDKGQSLDRFVAQHYIRLHTVPLGQWMSMDFARLAKLWNEEPVAKLIEAIKESGPRLGPQNAQIVEQVVAALSRAKQDQPIAKQTNDRGLFEAIAQIVGLRRATAPVAIDILERVVMPALHVGMPEKFPPLDEDDLGNLRKGIELFAFFVEVVPHKYQADDEGFLGTIPHDQLTTPYADRNVLEIGKGDWVVVNPVHFIPMLQEFDPQKLLDKYDEFVKYLAVDPRGAAPARRRADARRDRDPRARRSQGAASGSPRRTRTRCCSACCLRRASGIRGFRNEADALRPGACAPEDRHDRRSAMLRQVARVASRRGTSSRRAADPRSGHLPVANLGASWRHGGPPTSRAERPQVSDVSGPRSGSDTTNRAPPVGARSGATASSPPCSIAIFRAIARPRPVPVDFVVT